MARDGPGIKPQLDHNLPPVVPHSLKDWNARFLSMVNARDMYERDAFALTGRYRDPTEPDAVYRAKIDLDTCKLRSGMRISQVCDIDSVLGLVMGRFPIAQMATFKYYMLPSVIHTLTSNLHLPLEQLPDQYERETPAPLHKLPNARFGEMGEQFLVRIFFPNLDEGNEIEDTTVVVRETYLQRFYDYAVIPAAEAELPPAVVRNWPANYNNEWYRANPNGGGGGDEDQRGRAQPQQTGRDVHAQDLNPWLDGIRRRVNDDERLAFARGFFFLVELKGVKNKDGIMHDPPEEPLINEEGEIIDPDNGRTFAVEHLLRDFDIDEFERGHWYLDIATTVSVELESGQAVCGLPSANAHPEIIQHFTGLPIAECVRLVNQRSGCYQRDEVAHLGEIAGFRITLEEPGAHGICYLQVYSTDKAVIYRPNGKQKAKSTSARSILDDWQRERQNHFIPLQSAFISASATHSTAVRFESRIPFENYPFVHHEIEIPTVAPWVSWLHNSAFWGFKANRLMAINSMIERFDKARPQYQTYYQPTVGSFLILLAWMANALVNRPEDGSRWDEVRDSGSVHVARGGQVVPDRPLTAYFIHSLKLNQAGFPRISGDRVISEDTILYLFSRLNDRQTVMGLHRLITRARLPNQDPDREDPWDVDGVQTVLAAQRIRNPNRQRLVRNQLVEDVADVFAKAIPEPERDDRCESEDDDPEEREGATPRSQLITTIIHTFPVQVFAKAPNRKGTKYSWCLLDSSEMLEVGFHIFSDKTRLRDLFVSYHLLPRNAERWRKTVETYFPTPAEHAMLRQKGKKIQGLDALQVWQDWETLLASVSIPEAKHMAAEARKYVGRHWRWLPAVYKNHLWATGSTNLPAGSKQVGCVKGGPWIVLNPAFRN